MLQVPLQAVSLFASSFKALGLAEAGAAFAFVGVPAFLAAVTELLVTTVGGWRLSAAPLPVKG